MIIECELKYNNKSYGKGPAYIAKIVGEDPIYKFKREFIDRDVEYRNSSSTTWYNYSWSVSENGVYEWSESNSYKSYKQYFIYDSELDDFKIIQKEDVIEEIKTKINI